MRRGIKARRAALVFLTLLAGVIGAALAAPPTISVRGGATFDAGKIGREPFVTHSFVLFNPHPYPVALTVPPPEGCACVTVRADRNQIAAFGTAQVTIQIEGGAPGAMKQTEGARVFVSQNNRQSTQWLFVRFYRAK